MGAIRNRVVPICVLKRLEKWSIDLGQINQKIQLIAILLKATLLLIFYPQMQLINFDYFRIINHSESFEERPEIFLNQK